MIQETPMRQTALISLAVCGAAFALGTASPVRAQETPSTPPPAAVAPAPMPTPASMPEQPLVIPAPSGLTLQVEMDLHDDDLLGVFKSLLRGVGQAANSAQSAANAKPASAKTARDTDIAAILSNADLSDVLKDVTHIHFALYGPPTARTMGVVKPSVKAGAAVPAPNMSADSTAFYETAFASEGGRRVIFVNSEPVHVLMTSFGKGRGFAFLVQSPGSVGVLRADGYPDLSKLAALATSIGTTVGKTVMDEAMKPDTPKH